MNDQEFAAKQQEILADIPEVFHGALSYYAYREGHSGGNNDILIILEDLVEALKEPIMKFEEQVELRWTHLG